MRFKVEGKRIEVKGSTLVVWTKEWLASFAGNRNPREYRRGKEGGCDSGQRKRKGQEVELDRHLQI